jgi:hypothetical protein
LEGALDVDGDNSENFMVMGTMQKERSALLTFFGYQFN